MTRRIAVFYATVGTGHKAAACAIRDWQEKEFPGSQVLCRDMLDYTPPFVRFCITRSYLFMARRAPWLWGKLYGATDREANGRGSAFWNALHNLISRLYLRRLMREIGEFKPDVILSTHFFAMSMLLDVLQGQVPVFCVGTDYVGHALQRDPRFHGYFVASDESVRQHRADGIPDWKRRVRDLGIPVSPLYENPPSRSDSREKLGLDEATVHIVIAGGGIGAGDIEAAADSMVEHCRDGSWRVDVLCGNNGALVRRLREKYASCPNIHAREFIENIIDYYTCCDVLVLKPGGLSSAESSACGCAVLLIDPLPGQEQHNCDYLLARGAALRVHESSKTGRMIEELVGSDNLRLRELRESARRAGRPLAGRDIVRAVDETLRP